MSHQRPADARLEAMDGAEIHIRNYDVETGHSVWINVVDHGDQVLETTRRLRPGEVRNVTGAIPPGEYDVEVGVDGLRREVVRCRIGPGPEQTALVELGNGVVSVTDGLH